MSMRDKQKRTRTKVVYFQLLRGLQASVAFACIAISGCSIAPPPSALGTAGVPGAAAQPMTLPRYLGIDSVAIGARRVVYRSRLRMSSVLPFLEPRPAASAPAAITDPCCIDSPSPAVATAASIQLAEAAAPAKVKALGYLASMDCGRNPQVEEAIVAAMDDASESVRLAAVQAVVTSSERCGRCACQCGGCCTNLIQSKLMHLAFGKDDTGCWCEPSAKVRRIARIALGNCQPHSEGVSPEIPLEVPSPQAIEMAQIPVSRP